MPKTILIIEDHPEIRQGLMHLVRQLGHEPVSASTVQDGLEKLAFNPSHVLLNLNLPDGRGTTVLRHIRQNDLPIKAAIVSATTDESLIAEAKRVDPDAAIIPKGRWDDLIDWLER